MAAEQDRSFSWPTMVTRDRSELCRSVLGRLPEWFGRPVALTSYADAAAGLPMLACFGSDGAAVGILSLKPQTSAATEVHVMGVLSAWHRRGIGRALIEAAARYAREQGARLLTVKTLAPEHPDPNYAATRAFYEALGFLPVEVLPTLWAEDLPCLQMSKLLATDWVEPQGFDGVPVEAAKRQFLDASTHPQPQSVVAAGYDRIADAYLARFGRSAVRDRKLAELIDELRPGASVLDLGCGAGVPVARTLVDHGFAVTGVDISPAQVGRARKAVPEASFIAADMMAITFPSARFDAVSAFYAFSHVPRGEHAVLLPRLAGWLRPGGVLLASFGAEAGDWAGEWLGVPMVFSHNAPAMTQRLLADAGLVVERTEVLQQDNEDAAFLWITARKG